MSIDAERLEEELKRIRDRREVKEMTPYGPVLDAPKVCGREYYQAVVNDPNASVSARRQARIWLETHKPGKGVKGRDHYMVKRKRARTRSLQRYWHDRMYENFRLFRWKKGKRGEEVCMTKEEHGAITSWGERNVGERRYQILRKDSELPWQWDNLIIVRSGFPPIQLLDVQRELKRPDVHHTGHPDGRISGETSK